MARHRRAHHRPRAGRLVLRARRRTSAARWWSSIAPEGSSPRLLDAHGDVIATRDRAASRAQHGRPRSSERAAGGGPTAPQRCRARRLRLAVVSAADPVDRATGRLVHLPDAPFLLGELSPADVLAGARRRPGHGRQRRQLGGPRRTRRRRRAADWTTSPTSTWARAWAAPSSATARSAADTPASSARSPTSSPPVPDGRRRPLHRGLRRARPPPARHRPRSTSPASWRRSARRGCASTRSAGDPGPRGLRRPRRRGRPLPTPSSSSSAARGAPTPVVLDAIAASSSDSPAMSRSGPRDHRRTLPRRRPRPRSPPTQEHHHRRPTTADVSTSSLSKRQRQHLRTARPRWSRGRCRPGRASRGARDGREGAPADAAELLDGWPQVVEDYSGDELVVKVRDKELRTR